MPTRVRILLLLVERKEQQEKGRRTKGLGGHPASCPQRKVKISEALWLLPQDFARIGRMVLHGFVRPLPDWLAQVAALQLPLE